MSTTDRKYWLDMLLKLADPVLKQFAARTLHANLNMEVGGPDREKYKGLEILGRTLSGLSPWLETPAADREEESLRCQYADLAREAINSATDPESPDYCVFNSGEKVWNEQWLVDAAHLALGIVRAPKELGESLPDKVKENLANALRKTRNIRAVFNNWLLFSATVEAALYVLGEDYDVMRVDFAIRQMEEWYIGDGFYMDGPRFQLDYYNGFVIQPMYVTLINLFHGNYVEKHHLYSRDMPVGDKMLKLALPRLKRYARIQEMSIAPDGSFPPFGRSIIYRCGAFQALAQAAWWEMLPKEVTPAMARCALTKVIRKTLEADGTFDENGWLAIGLCGHQPNLAHPYITTASLYACSQVFLPLGLPEDRPFWADDAELTTWEKMYSGDNLHADYPLSLDDTLY
ncbi:MAG: DUF2264 domain-containing protein [Clostridia bacterium]|nr:DUF2264 domain-containing protein [Clostridia bacterium]